MDLDKFSALDIFLFAITFLLSAVIGLYHGCRSRRANTREEYLLGGRKLGLFPVTASLVATAVSGSTLLGQAAEVYVYGTQAWLLAGVCYIMSIIVPIVYLPVFLEVGELSSFKYLELRFSRSVRIFASVLYSIVSLLFLSVTVYVPALAVHEFTGVSVHLTTGLLTIVCVFYTAIGGIKAVVWTDVFQITLTLVSSIIVVIVGAQQVGGFGKVYEATNRGGRLVFFNLDPDPTVRSTFWEYLFSMTLVAIYQFGISQTSTQRFLALSDLRKMRLALWGLTLFFTIFLLLSQTIGAIIFTTYETCDPFKAGLIRKIDQILPHYIERTASVLPGFSGIFIAGIFCASLSSTSSFLNTLSGSIYDDFLSRRFRNASEAKASNIVKFIVVILGIVQMFLLLLIEKLGTIFNMTAQCLVLATSALLGLFTLGMLCRRVNTRGALAGSIVSVVAISILTIGGLYKSRDPFLPLRTDGCDPEIFNATTLPQTPVESTDGSDIPWVFKIHFLYHALIGFSLNLIVGYVVSVLTGGNPSVDEKLLARFLRRTQKGEEEVKLNDVNGENGKVLFFRSE
ncbi:sodium-coupled monocarboxylate transporter 2-like [Phlebotomus argentipes]|uniref:sodium-coupled monocarboxylate transporter 2-like n=1 Tax=Phlebotomus argentipes TaxID=94469 RepID=UPI0028934E19|nr:sodium-coupled monocarboxylate transporter 2-like [Phlebotomus argentipes]